MRAIKSGSAGSGGMFIVKSARAICAQLGLQLVGVKTDGDGVIQARRSTVTPRQPGSGGARWVPSQERILSGARRAWRNGRSRESWRWRNRLGDRIFTGLVLCANSDLRRDRISRSPPWRHAGVGRLCSWASVALDLGLGTFPECRKRRRVSCPLRTRAAQRRPGGGVSPLRFALVSDQMFSPKLL